jgi:hypothetical protein
MEIVLYSVELRKSSILLLLYTMMIGLPWNVIIEAAPHASAPRMDVIGNQLTGPQTTRSGTSDVLIVENGGFEEGLQGWQVTNLFLASSGSCYPCDER